MTDRTATLLTAPPLTLLLQMTGPNTAAFMIQAIVNLTEVWIVGQLGTQALAAIALVFPLLILMQAMSSGAVGGAISSAIARKLGHGDQDSAEKLVWQGFYISTLAAIAFFVIFVLFGEAFLRFLGGRGAVLEDAIAYCWVLFIGGIFIWLSAAVSSVFRGAGDMVFPAKLMVLSAIFQVPLSAGLVLGWFGLPQLGVMGAAVSIVTIHGLMSLIMVRRLMNAKVKTPLRQAQSGWQRRLINEILRVARPAALNPLLNIATVLGLTALVSRFGTDALAGYGIGTRIEFIMLPVIFAFGTALTTIVGTNIGAGQYDRAEAAGWYGVLCAGLLAGLIGSFLALFPDLWIPLFTQDPNVHATATRYIQIVGPAYAGLGIGLVLYFASQGAGAMKWPIIGMITRFVIAMGIAVPGVVYYGMEIEVIFYAGALAMAIYATLIALAIYRGAWRP